jgi:hypothetical protein
VSERAPLLRCSEPGKSIFYELPKAKSLYDETGNPSGSASVLASNFANPVKCFIKTYE